VIDRLTSCICQVKLKKFAALYFMRSAWAICSPVSLHFVAWAAKIPELLKPEGLLMTVEDMQKPATGVADLLHNRCVVREFNRIQQICRFSLLSDWNVRWPRRMLPSGESRWACRRDRQTDRRTLNAVSVICTCKLLDATLSAAGRVIVACAMKNKIWW